jgi:HAD superfamily hydrolase (TIGR01549 family)
MMPSDDSPESRDVLAGSAVLFDMDGTLTQPCLDFDVIRREIGLPPEPRTPVLEAIEAMSPEQRHRAEQIVLRHEADAAKASTLWHDTLSVLSAIRGAGIPVGCITRNSRRSAETVMALHGLHFDALYTRENGPLKPSPEPVHTICCKLHADPRRAWMVGDYLFDIQAGCAAGATTVLMLGDARLPEWSDQADHVIRRLTELLDLLSIAPAPNADS